MANVAADPSSSSSLDALTRFELSRREFYFYNLYRMLQSTLFVGVAFSPLFADFVELRLPLLAQSVALGFMVLALAGFLLGQRRPDLIRALTLFGVTIDCLVAGVAMYCVVGMSNGIALLLVVNVGAGAVLLPPRMALSLAALAGVVTVGEGLIARQLQGSAERNLVEATLFGVTYVGLAALVYLLAQRLRESQALAEKRGVEVANLAQLNELIIRRMRSGVIVVDRATRMHLCNEVAWMMLGQPPLEQRDLGELAPALAQRLHMWRTGQRGGGRGAGLILVEGGPEVVTHFTALNLEGTLYLIFLEDISLLSQRAEEMTLASLGRLSASIAHEIRNPLAAISYSAQLLAESEDLNEADKRLVEIVNSHCQRMNGIVENILQLSRRERSRPEELDLVAWTLAFVEDYRSSHDMGHDELRSTLPKRPLGVIVDPQHLHQVVTNLVDNARRYGRDPGQPARVVLAVVQESARPARLDVIDRGPGIPARVAESIFEPFFTTHEFGTGLGLYIARQLCEANGASLDYRSIPGGGSCFRIAFAPAPRLGQPTGADPRPGSEKIYT
ncbi:MAG TPA: MFS domain-containing histidine kinase [Xanthomonadaceae bacterium]|nr:MFS domain-containing histidine kinase [Xanthomonadaceae bacterium]